METLSGELLLYIARYLEQQLDIVRWSAVCKFIRGWLTTLSIDLRLPCHRTLSVSCVQQAIIGWPYIQSINCTGKTITRQHASALAPLRHLRTIKLENCTQLERRCVQQLLLQNRNNLVDLAIYGDGPYVVLRIDKSFSALETVRLDFSNISAAAFNGILRCPSLRDLAVVDCCNIYDFDFANIGKCANLRRLVFETPVGLSASLFSGIGESKTLEEIRIHDPKLDDRCVACLVTLPNLRRLNIASSKHVSDSCGVDLNRCPRLESVRFSYCNQLTSALHDTLARNPIMRTLKMHCCAHLYGDSYAAIADSTEALGNVLYIRKASTREYRFNVTPPPAIEDYLTLLSDRHLRYFHMYLAERGECATLEMYYAWLCIPCS